MDDKLTIPRDRRKIATRALQVIALLALGVFLFWFVANAFVS